MENDMLKRIGTLLVAMAGMGIMHAHVPMDSLVSVFKTTTKPKQQTTVTSEGAVTTTDTSHVVPAVEQKPTYPKRYAITEHPDLEKELMALHLETVNETIRRLNLAARRKRNAVEGLDVVAEQARKGEAGLRGVDNVIVIDSVVVDKEQFLKAYPLSADLGALTCLDKGKVVQYQTQLNGMVLRPQTLEADSTGQLHLVRYYLENSQLTEGSPIEGLGTDGDQNYPFLMPDGQTLYFAARSGDGYGNYDLYATRYDSEAKRFYQAENMGFPYNSMANDYMLVIDEAAQLGWFASDRYQPDGKVCIYSFVPNASRHTLDYDTTDPATLRAAASLCPLEAIALTAEQQQAKKAAQRRLRQRTATAGGHELRDFEFVLNDQKTCYTLDDFSTAEAKRMCKEWIQKSKNVKALEKQLEDLRDKAADNRQTILNLERRIVELQEEVHGLAKAIRASELKESE